MRKRICLLVLAIFVATGCGYTGTGKGTSKQVSATVEVAGPIKMDKKASATITGKGFKPGQEINILFTAEDGAQSDIGYGLKPAPKPDASGAWSTTWAAGDFVARKMVEAGGSYKLTVTDSEYNPVAHTSVAFTK